MKIKWTNIILLMISIILIVYIVKQFRYDYFSQETKQPQKIQDFTTEIPDQYKNNYRQLVEVLYMPAGQEQTLKLKQISYVIDKLPNEEKDLFFRILEKHNKKFLYETAISL